LGEPSDQKAYQVLKQGPTRIADITEGLALLPLTEGHSCHEHIHNDLHIWLSPKLAQRQAEMIARHLSVLLPENQMLYERALAELLADLHKVDEEIRAELAPKHGSAILVSHPAFAYFCKEYALEQLSIEIEGKEPLPQDIQTLLQRIKEHNIVSVLSEPQYSDKAAKLMADHLHAAVYEIDPYAPDYLDNLRRLAHVIAQ
jgi:zinc transport system substrate-binding protein